MITRDEIQQMAHIAALSIMSAPRGLAVLEHLETLILAAYQRGMEDGSVRTMEARTQRDFEELLGKTA